MLNFEENSERVEGNINGSSANLSTLKSYSQEFGSK